WDRNGKRVMLAPPALGIQPERQVVNTDGNYFRHRLAVRHCAATRLKNCRQIIAASTGGRPMVARTEFRRHGHRILLEYPVFTLNVSERHQYYQTDTGSVIFPDLTVRTKRLGHAFRLAFAAFNSPDWVEFIIQRPTPIGGGYSVNHYSKTLQLGSRNALF